MLKRLKNHQQFQGAAYELRVAGVFARLGFKINFLDDTDRSIKHCEFLATKEDLVISVETKSKHREGILNHEGVIDYVKINKRNINFLINEAKEQI